MISYLSGKIINKSTSTLIVVVNNIGYKVFVNETVIADTKIGDEIELYTYHHVREDAQLLFGFYNVEQLDMFELLISVSGIGPKSALGVLAVGDVGFIRDSIASGDSGILIKVSGIGKKTAERVVMELRDKVGSINFSDIQSGGTASSSADEIDALIALGYSTQQAREALKKVDPAITDSGERVRAALRNI